MAKGNEPKDPVFEFIDESLWHGPLDRAEAIRATQRDLADRSIYAAAVLGDDAAIGRFLEQNPALATEKGGPRGWDALTYLCFSKYLRRDTAPSEGFLRAARALLDAGASANTGFFDESHKPSPEWESALYGAAGVAHHAELTRLLLEHGADPNDGEVPYHTPETYDNRALRVLLDSGKLNDDSLTMLLLRKSDWHDYDGLELLLDFGVDPNRRGRWGHTVIHHAIWSDNSSAIVELLLDHGADPMLPPVGGAALSRPRRGQTAPAMAAWTGRGDLLELFEKRGIRLELRGIERLLAACARDDATAVQRVATEAPALAREVLDHGAELLQAFARVGNSAGVRHLLDLGVPVAMTAAEGSGYFDIAKNSTALHVAAWRAQHGTLKLLLERGAPVDSLDGALHTPLQLAVRACVDSYWMDRRSPESVAALLRAGASVRGVRYPSGYDEVDALLAQHGAR